MSGCLGPLLRGSPASSLAVSAPSGQNGADASAVTGFPEQPGKHRPANHRNAEALRLVELRAGALSGHAAASALRHAPGGSDAG